MGQLLLLTVVALTVAAIIFGITVLISGSDPGLAPAEPDGRAIPLPSDRPLIEDDVARVRFDTAVRGYRMAQVDQALRRASYDLGYKDELIGVLEAEVTALREGRIEEADLLRQAREAALTPANPPAAPEAVGAEQQHSPTGTPASPAPPEGPLVTPPVVVDAPTPPPSPAAAASGGAASGGAAPQVVPDSVAAPAGVPSPAPPEGGTPTGAPGAALPPASPDGAAGLAQPAADSTKPESVRALDEASVERR